MLVHEFFGKYANTKLDARSIPIKVPKEVSELYVGNPKELTLDEMYFEIHRLENEMIPMRVQQEKLIKAAEKTMMDNQA